MSTANGKSNGTAERPLPWNKGPQDQVVRFGDAIQTWRDGITERILNRYKGADLDRFTRDMIGTNMMGTSADFHYKEESRFFRMIELARDIDREDMTASQGLDRLCVNVLQDGFKYDPTTGDEEVDEYCKEWWKDYSEDEMQVDLQQERDFTQLSWAILRASFCDGDQLVNPLDTGQFQTVEAHLLRTPHGKLEGDARRLTSHGVELDWERRRKRYHVAQDDVPMQETLKFQYQDFTTLEAFDSNGNPNAFHVKHNFKRTGSQTRGVSIFSPIVHLCGMQDDIEFAKLVQQQSVSSWVAQIERDMAGDYPDEEEFNEAEMRNLCRPGQWTQLENLNAGMIYKGVPGEKLHGFSPNVPNPSYMDHSRQVREVLGTNLYLPYIVLMMDASVTNFSGWRGAMNQAQMLWKWLQINFSKAWHRPAVNFRMRQAITPGHQNFDPFLAGASRRVNVFSHRWQMPAWPYVNPIEDVAANAMEVQKLQNSPRRVQSKQGRDYQEVIVGELLDDNYSLVSRAMELADELQAAYPDQLITWDQLIAVPTPDNVSVNMSKALEDASVEDNAAQQQIGGNPAV